MDVLLIPSKDRGLKINRQSFSNLLQWMSC
jgi:hypothetical protein